MPNLNTLMAQPLRPVTVPGIPKLHNRRPTLRRPILAKNVAHALAVCAMLVVVAGCAPDFADQVNPIMARFADLETVASGTARIGLGPVIIQMQDAARELDALNTGDPEMQALIVHAMNITIDYYLAFSRQDADRVVTALHDEAETAWAAITDLQAIRNRDRR